MPYASALDAAAARKAIYSGDDAQLERYLREGGNNPVTSATGATASGAGTIVMNRAAGVTYTLPPATGSQTRVFVVVQTTFTGSGIIKVANSLDSFIGNITFVTTALAAGSEMAPPAGSDTITMNGGTTGGAQGSMVELIDVAPTLWLIRGELVCVGAAASPYSNVV